MISLVNAEAKLIKDISIEVTNNVKTKIERKKMTKIFEICFVGIFTIKI
jgi:hypothetical protein